MRFLILLYIATFFSGSIYAQTRGATSDKLYLPLEFRRAYENGTRSMDGQVPVKYWQNKADYRISAGIDPATGVVDGFAEITYYNNSPDTLWSVTFHSYHDYLKPYASREGYDQPSSQARDHDGMEIKALLVAEERIDLNDPQKVRYGGTNYTVQLSDPLAPADSLYLSIAWNYVIPDERYERSGKFDSTSMFVAYWYPEIAVRDDIFGWDRKAFDSATEFYHDFSDYEVSVTVPDNYTVWASVAPDNPEEVYSAEVLKRLEQAQRSSTSVTILDPKNFRKSTGNAKTWEYTARNFPDFAFALSDHYVWEAATYTDEEGEYFIQTAYPHDTPEFSKILPTISTALELFHNSFPKYPFPYKHFTVFHGQAGGGMEFPGMANNGFNSRENYKRWFGIDISEEQELRANLDLTLHEMAHSYFPFMMGINEKKFAWMDEGFAQVSKTFLGNWLPRLELDFSSLGSLSVVPLMVPSDEHDLSYMNAYQVGPAAYHSLYLLLGNELFFRGLHAYMDEWKYKHPTPYDLAYTFNRETKEDLTWFFENWLFEWGYIDIGIAAVDGKTIKIENNGGKAVGFEIKMKYSDGRIDVNSVSPGVWRNSATYDHFISAPQSLKEVELIFPIMGDAVSENNVWSNG